MQHSKMTRALLFLIPILLAACAPRFNAKVPSAVPAVQGKVVKQYTMRYIEIKTGTGLLAEPGKVFSVHYTGWLRDGTKFDSSVDRKEPITFEQGKRRVIPGWDAGFEGMRVGGKRRFFIPYQLAYGELGRNKIPGKAELIFDVELINVTAAPPSTPPAK